MLCLIRTKKIASFCTNYLGSTVHLLMCLVTYPLLSALNLLLISVNDIVR